MSNNNTVNIKSLPQASEIVGGDLFMLETKSGTKMLDFDKFIITEYNTTFQPTLSSHTSQINLNKTSIKTLSSSNTTLTTQWSGVNISTLCTTSAVKIRGNNLTVGGAISGQTTLTLQNLSALSQTSNYFEGYIGIGTNYPLKELQLSGTSNPGIRITDATNNAYGDIYVSNDGSISIAADAGDNVAGTSIVFKVDGTDNGAFYKQNLGIGTILPTAKLHVASVSAAIMVESATYDAPDPGQHVGTMMYIRAGKLIFRYNDSGTTRYKYMVLSGTAATWVAATTAP